MTATGIGRAVEEAARFGGGSDGGVTRLAWEPALFDAYEWLRGRAAACGLESRIDPAGNLVIAWDAGEGPAVAVGSLSVTASVAVLPSVLVSVQLGVVVEPHCQRTTQMRLSAFHSTLVLNAGATKPAQVTESAAPVDALVTSHDETVLETVCETGAPLPIAAQPAPW